MYVNTNFSYQRHNFRGSLNTAVLLKYWYKIKCYWSIIFKNWIRLKSIFLSYSITIDLNLYISYWIKKKNYKKKKNINLRNIYNCRIIGIKIRNVSVKCIAIFRSTPDWLVKRINCYFIWVTWSHAYVFDI